MWTSRKNGYGYVWGSSAKVLLKSLTKAVLVYPTFVMELTWRRDWIYTTDLQSH